MTLNPAIDVLIPVFNAADTLDEALASIATQSFQDFRVIVVDDGSTDDTSALLKRWAEEDSRFTFLSQPNAGIVQALNTALSRSSAPLIARMDADDISNPARFRLQTDYLRTNPDCVAVSGEVRHIDETNAPIADLPRPGDPGDADYNWIPAREPYLMHPFLMARREAVLGVGGYRFVPHSEDSDLYWRLAEVGRLHNLDAVMGHYRFHTHSISGASIINGRIMAVGSQLGAFAARSRARREADSGFGDNLVPLLKKAGSLEAMCQKVETMVAETDRPQFGLAVSIKLLELTAYRPYEIEPSDCRYIADTVRAGLRSSLPPENRAEIEWHLGETAARLLRQGRPRDAALLAPTRLWPKALAKAALR